jgi:carboxypeptidase Taq
MVVSKENSLKNYDSLMDKVKEVIILNTAGGVIHWDMETKMPPKGIELRSLQLALLSKIEHGMMLDTQISKLLDKVKEDSTFNSLNEIQRRNVYLFKRLHDEAACLPETLVSEMAKQEAIATDVWKKAKATNNYLSFQPELKKLLELKKKAANLLMDVKEVPTQYDALIDRFEPRLTSYEISRVFNELRRGLIAIINKCSTLGDSFDTSFLKLKVPIDIQRDISLSIANFLEYDVVSDKAGGRIDETEHPFSTGYYDDVRITTHYYETDFIQALYSTLHECGHAIYEQNLNPNWKYQLIGSACSSGFHESQSRFVENIIGRSPEFWAFYLPKLSKLTGGAFSDITVSQFVKAVTQVKPSKIRIQADEVTYSLHIIIRFEIERDLFADKIQVEELPQVWNEKYEEYLGIEIESDSEGVLQDTHWASGSFGYFPSYALGNIYSGQILAKMMKELPEWKIQISKGDFKQIKQWLIDNVYAYGNQFDPSDFIRNITGEEVNVKPFLVYLDKKFSNIYGY